ncbi:MAG: DNA-directed RNA polymerase subunit RpoH/Rpb5 C-terminal domain-containing protein [archaeon]
MHVLQPKHTKLKDEEVQKILKKFDISLSQLPRIAKKDPALPEGCEKGDVVKIERKGDVEEVYYRVVI